MSFLLLTSQQPNDDRRFILLLVPLSGFERGVEQICGYNLPAAMICDCWKRTKLSYFVTLLKNSDFSNLNLDFISSSTAAHHASRQMMAAGSFYSSLHPSMWAAGTAFAGAAQLAANSSMKGRARVLWESANDYPPLMKINFEKQIMM